MFKNQELNTYYDGGDIIHTENSAHINRIAYLLLLETDYAMLSDVVISNKDEFVSYRAKLRNVLSTSLPAYQFPLPPEPQWTETEE